MTNKGFDPTPPKVEKKKQLDPMEIFGKKKSKGLDLAEGDWFTTDQIQEKLGLDPSAVIQAMEDSRIEGEQQVNDMRSPPVFHDINPFPFIFKAPYDFKFEENREKIEKSLTQADKIIEEHQLRTPEMGGGTTSVVLMGCGVEDSVTKKVTPFQPPHAWEEWNHFTTVWLPEQLEKVWQAWRLEPCHKYISESWINKHPVGAWTEEHDHQNVTIAMGCYLNVPKDSGRLMIKNPLQMYKYSEPIHHTYWDKSPTTGDDMSWAYIPVETNDVVFFPGWLRHKTEVNKNKEGLDRYIMSCNVRYQFKMRGSLAGMQNLPGSENVDTSNPIDPNMELSGNSVTDDRVNSREMYDKSIFT